MIYLLAAGECYYANVIESLWYYTADTVYIEYILVLTTILYQGVELKDYKAGVASLIISSQMTTWRFGQDTERHHRLKMESRPREIKAFTTAIRLEDPFQLPLLATIK